MYEQNMSEQQEPRKQMSGCAKAGIGCGIALVIVLIILAIGGWYVYKNARGWTATGFAAAANEVVDQSTIPDEQKQAIRTRVDQVRDDFIAGDITWEEFGQAVENLEVEKLVAAGMAQSVGTRMIDSSKLSDDKKAEGKQALDRIAYGLLEGQINESEARNVLAPIMQDPTANDWQLKENPTAEELQQVMDNANDLADQKGIPQDVGEVDFAAKVNEAFDDAFGSGQTEPAETP